MQIPPKDNQEGSLQNPSEADARIVIDDLLRDAGWDPKDKSQVGTELQTDNGRADYVLYDSSGHPLAVIEAKRAGIQPYVAKQQALPYAQDVGAPFIFLSNGELVYFWDYENEDARLVGSFYSQNDLERVVWLRKSIKPMAEVPIVEDYLRQTESRTLRPYQVDAMKALDHAVELGKRRFLIQLPTGTGKTDLICLYLKRLIEANRASRILFLVDREQLAMQAIEAINDLMPEYSAYWRKAGVGRKEKQITVCLLQTLISNYEQFTSGYFDVVVTDESHRSIYGSWKPALNHFDAFHVGLTATPAAFIERNTFDFYRCKDGKPDVSYPMKDAIENKYLVGYKFARGITEIIDKGADKDEEHYDPATYWRKWTNEKTDKLMMEKFDEMAWASYEELAPGQKIGPGKSIVFAITKQHAARLAQILNERHPEHKGDYARVITSDVADATEEINKFKKDDYPQVAVSVGMLDTGFDCREILHLVMCRRVRSPILYQQMRGRGTRTAFHIDKRGFVIYDFFRNSEYFNDSDTEMFSDYATGHAPVGSDGKPKTALEMIELGLADEWAEHVTYIEVGPEGERIDKVEYLTDWQKTINETIEEDEALQKIRDDEALTDAEESGLAERLNQPRFYFNQQNLRLAYGDISGTLIDFINAALGRVRVKSREERVNEDFQAWLVTKSLEPEQAHYLTLLKNRGIARGEVALDDLFKPPLSLLNAGTKGIELFGKEGLREVVDEMNEQLFREAANG